MSRRKPVDADSTARTRVPIDAIGRKGYRVNVFGMRVRGEDVAAVEWREPVPITRPDQAPELRRRQRLFHGARREREEAARRFAETQSARLRDGDWSTPVRARPTIDDLWTYYRNAKLPDWRRRTLRLNESRWKVFLESFRGDRFADTVTPEDIDAWRTALTNTDREKTGEPMARNQIAHHVQLVKMVWSHALDRGHLPTNVLATYAVRKGRDAKPMQVPEYTPEEWTRILSQLNPRDPRQWRAWCAISLEGLLGTRSNAFLQLQWPQVSGVGRSGPRLIEWPRSTDKMGESNVQPLPRDAVLVLRIIRVWQRRIGYTGDYVFAPVQQRNADGHWTYSSLVRSLHMAADRGNVRRIKYRATHSLRRLSANNAAEATGGNVPKVAAWLNDTDFGTIRKSYLRRRVGDLDQLAQDLHLPHAAKQAAKRHGKAGARARRFAPATRKANKQQTAPQGRRSDNTPSPTET